MTTLAITAIQEPELDEDFAQEKDGAKKMVRTWLPVFKSILTAKGRTKAIDAAAKRMGVTFGRVRDNFYLWLNQGGDWRVNDSGRRIGLDHRRIHRPVALWPQPRRCWGVQARVRAPESPAQPPGLHRIQVGR